MAVRLIVLLFFFIFNSTVAAQRKNIDPYLLIDSLKKVVESMPENDKKASIYIRLAILYKNTSQFKEGIEYAGKGCSIARLLGNKAREASALNMIGVLNKDIGNYDKAIATYNEVLALLAITKDSSNIASTWVNIANINSIQGKNKEAIDAYIKALEVFTQVGSKMGMGICLTNLGIEHKLAGNYTEALKNFFAADDFFRPAAYFNGSAMIYNYVGDIYAQQGDYLGGIKYYLMSLQLNEKAKDPFGVAMSYTNIGNVYKSQNNNHEALRYYDSSLHIANKIGSKSSIASAYGNIGNVERSMGKVDEAILTLNKALNIYRELKDKSGESTILINLGLSYSDIKDFISSLDLLEKSLEISKNLNHKHDLANVYNTISYVYFLYAKQSDKQDQKNRFIISLRNALSALEIAKQLGIKIEIRNAYQNIGKAYDGLGNYKKAYEFTSLYNRISDSILNTAIIDKQNVLRIQYETEKVKTEEQLKKESEKLALQLKFTKKEDSLKYQKSLSDAELQQQLLLSQKQKNEIQLHEASLQLSNKQKELAKLAYLKTKAELEAEQSRLLEKENALTISEQEKRINQAQLNLQKTALDLKEKQLQAEKSKKIMYAGGAGLMLLFFGAVFWNVKSKQKANSVLAAEKLRTEKANAAHKMVELELQSLRTQLNPHFMFNSLNAIQELILMEDNENSHIYLARFSDLLRMLLDNATVSFIPLKKEIEFLNLYLSLEKLRIPDLEYRIEVDDDINSSATLIPNMMLQPYIENAIWHGLSHKKGSRELTIKATLREHAIIFSVEDNGVGRKKALELKSQYRKEHKSKGMELLSKRFNLLSREFGAEIQTSVIDLESNTGPQGTLVKIIVPISLSEKTKVALHDTHNYN